MGFSTKSFSETVPKILAVSSKIYDDWSEVTVIITFLNSPISINLPLEEPGVPDTNFHSKEPSKVLCQDVESLALSKISRVLSITIPSIFLNSTDSAVSVNQTFSLTKVKKSPEDIIIPSGIVNVFFKTVVEAISQPLKSTSESVGL